MKKGLIPLLILLSAFFLASVTVTRAQDDRPAATDYVGSQACAECHPSAYENWANSLHARMIQAPQASPTLTIILADFVNYTQVITDRQLKYTEKDVLYTIGSRYRQRYILQDRKTKRLVLGAGQWNVGGQGPVDSDNTWQNVPGGEDWLTACAGCHTTGLDIQAAEDYKVGDKALPFAELSVGCEACHGPGSAHIKSPSLDNIPVNAVEALDAAICGQCHTRGSSPVTRGKTYPYPIEYATGEGLNEKNFIPIEPSGFITDVNWWSNGYAKNYRQQYLEWQASAHANALQTVQAISAPAECLVCHSTEYALATARLKTEATSITALDLKAAQFGVTCQACHSPHKQGTWPSGTLLRDESYRLCTSCHNATARGQQALTAGQEVHYAAQEMIEGRGALDTQSKPSVHFPTGNKGANCADCHMPGTATNTDRGDTATHNWKIIMPGQSEAGQPDSCSACHANPQSGILQITTDTLVQLVSTRQDDIKNRIKDINKSLKDIKSVHPEWDPKAEEKSGQQKAYERAFTYASFVETDGSFGMHNHIYAQALLYKAETDLTKEALATPTTTPSPTPTLTPSPAPPTPVPTPTPVPPPSGGTRWSVWGGLVLVIGLLTGLLVLRRPTMS